MLNLSNQDAQHQVQAPIYLPYRFSVAVQELDAEARVTEHRYEVHAYTWGAEAHYFKETKGLIITDEEKIPVGTLIVRNGVPSFERVDPEHKGRIIHVLRDAYEQSKRTREHNNPRHTPIAHIRTALRQVFEVAGVDDLVARLG